MKILIRWVWVDLGLDTCDVMLLTVKVMLMLLVVNHTVSSKVVAHVDY